MRLKKIGFNLSNYYNRKIILSITVVMMILIFLDQIKNYYDNQIVNPFLSKIPSNTIIAFVFCLSCLFCLLFFFHAITTNKKISNWLFFIALFWISIFFYFRFSDHYLFSPYFNRNGIKYFDFCFVAFGAFTIVKIKGWIISEKAPKYFKDPFQIDIPIKNSSSDIYNRKEFAFELAKKIQSKLEQSNSGSLAIAINGEWGSGKTSFCNFIKEKIEKKDRIIIDFNPWRSSSSSRIIEDFFELLIDEVQKFDPTLSREVSKYAKTLTQINENIITKGIETFSDFLFDGNNKNEYYDTINESIEKSKKQIIIFIDDLDRLDKKEIIETLRLIRNTANFNNVVYIVSYDKEYILEAVKRFNKHNYRNFLEKIFQFEFLLPKYDNGIIRNQIKNILQEKLGTIYMPEINASVDFAGVSGKNITSRVIKTQREVIRLINSFLFEIKKLKNEVNLIDFYFVQLLKIKFPGIYKFIANHTDLFFIRENNKFRLRKISEKYLNDNNLAMLRMLDDSRSKDDKVEDTLIEDFIKRNESLGHSETEKDVIVDIIKELMKEKPVKGKPSSIDYRSFVYSSNFHKYFSIQLLESDFSSGDFERFRFGNYETYKNKVNKWLKEGRISDLQERLEKIKDFGSKDEWENHIKILIHIGKYQLTNSGAYGINYMQIIETLNYPLPRKNFGNQPDQKLIFFETENEYLEFLMNFFEIASDPYVFESSILSYALTQNSPLRLPKEEIHRLLYNYFKKYCDNHPSVTDDFRILHRNAVSRKDGYQDEYEYLPGVQPLFISHFLKYLTGSQLSGWIKHYQPNTNLFTINYEWLKTFFEEPIFKKLESYLKSSENIKAEKDHYEEFMKFYFAFQANNYNPIEFHFEYLQPSLWK